MRIALLSALLAGCAAAPFPAPDAPSALVRADARAYETRLVRGETFSSGRPMPERVEVEIPYQLGPWPAETVYVGCQPPRPPTLEKRVGDAWETAYVSLSAACQSAPFVLAAGAVHRDTLRVVGFAPSEGLRETFRTSVPGTYRLVAYASSGARPDGGGDGLLPKAARASDPFELSGETPRARD